MHWGAYSSVFLLATIKYMVAPLAGWQLDLSFAEIAITSIVGGLISFSIFYLSANYFFERAKKKRIEKLLSEGKNPKKFTKTNKLVVKIKKAKYGYFAIVFFAPSFLSIPLGSLIVAKFFGHLKMTYWYTILALTTWGILMTLFWMITA